MFTRQQKQRALALLAQVQALEEDVTALQPLGFVRKDHRTQSSEPPD